MTTTTEEPPVTSAPTTTEAAATSAPTTEAAVTQAATTEAPADGPKIVIQITAGSNAWWLGFSVSDRSIVDKIESVQIMDRGSALPEWTTMHFQGDSYWSMYYILPGVEMAVPLSLKFNFVDGTSEIVSNIITSFEYTSINTGIVV